MNDPLAPLLADGVIDEISARLKSGKEADLWLVLHGGELVAAKVYKARQGRSFKNNAGYKEGRQVRDSRTQRAMDRGSRFGLAAAEEAWKAKESDALHALHAAGVRVPRPVMFYEGVLLMEVVVDAAGHPAPRLVDAAIPQEAAAGLYADLRGQAVRMLCCDLIHGDLSPYNVLLAWNGPVVIDFPQVVGAAHNSQAEKFFLRDLENLRRFFEGIDPALRAATNDGNEIWRAYVRRQLTPDFVPSGKPAEPERRRPSPPPEHRARPQFSNTGREHGRPERPRGAPPSDARPPQRAEPRHAAATPGGARPPQRAEARNVAPTPGDARSPQRAEARNVAPTPGGARQPQRAEARNVAPAPGDARSAQRVEPRPAAATPRGAPGGPGSRPGERGGNQRRSDQRRGAPAPEVVRVTRPPLDAGVSASHGPKPTLAAPRPPAEPRHGGAARPGHAPGASGTGHAGGGWNAGGAGHAGGRRRRRRRRHG